MQTPPTTAADTGDLIGFIGLVVVVIIVVVIGLVSLLQWSNRHAPADSFVEDFIPLPADVADIEASLPKFGDPR